MPKGYLKLISAFTHPGFGFQFTESEVPDLTYEGFNFTRYREGFGDEWIFVTEKNLGYELKYYNDKWIDAFDNAPDVGPKFTQFFPYAPNFDEEADLYKWADTLK